MFGKFKVVQNADGSYKVEKNRKRLFGLLGTKQIIRDGDNVTERVLKTKKDGSVVIYAIADGLTQKFIFTPI